MPQYRPVAKTLDILEYLTSLACGFHFRPFEP